MLKKKEAFLKILCIELEDLNEDIDLLIKNSKEKFSHDEISNYVFLENLAVLKNELIGVKSFCGDVKNTNPAEYETLKDMMDDLIKKLKLRIHEKGLAHSIIVLVERKMKKVIGYIEKE